MYCPKCGAYNAEGGNYCQVCGASMAGATSTPPPFGTIPQTAAPVIQRTSGMAVAALVMGIIGFFFGLCSILAIIFGGIAMSETKKNPNIGGRGMAVAGLVLGIITIVGWVIVGVIIVFFGMISASYY